MKKQTAISLASMAAACVVLLAAVGKNKKNDMENKQETMVLIETSLGDIKVKLYDDTPRHRDNFIKLVEEGTLDGTLFHRVIKDFMIQGGDPESVNAPAGKQFPSISTRKELWPLPAKATK